MHYWIIGLSSYSLGVLQLSLIPAERANGISVQIWGGIPACPCEKIVRGGDQGFLFVCFFSSHVCMCVSPYFYTVRKAVHASWFECCYKLRVFLWLFYCSIGPPCHTVVYCWFLYSRFMQVEPVGRWVSSPSETHVISCERRSLYVCYNLKLWRTQTSIGLFCEDHSSLGHIILVLQFSFCFCFTTPCWYFTQFDILVSFIDAVVLCVFCDSIILLLYMCPLWIKRSGLVTPPSGAADLQFPTRPRNNPEELPKL